MSEQSELDKLSEKRRHELEAAIAAFAASLGVLIDHWDDRLNELLDQDWSHAAPEQIYAAAQSRLLADLDKAQYPAAINELVGTYPAGYDAADAQREVLGLDPRDWDDDTAGLRMLQMLDKDRLARLGHNTAMELAGSVVFGLVMGQSRTEARGAANRVLHAATGAWEQISETGVYVASRFLTNAGFADQPKVRYLFAGPRDNRNSKFCAEHVNHTYTRAEIDKLDNGLASPYNNVWLFGGHPRCRHTFLPQA